MALEGELKGLDGTTCDCGTELLLQIHRSNGGHYLGYFCPKCGPYSRETGYYRNYVEAETALSNYVQRNIVPDNIRRLGWF